MKLLISEKEIAALTIRQIDSIFPLTETEKHIIEYNVPEVLQKCETCFEKSTDRYYNHDGQTYFSMLHADQHTVFLYFLSNLIFNIDSTTIYKVGGGNNVLITKHLGEKIFRLNKMLNGCDIYCTVKLPPIFKIVHGLGIVIAPPTKIGNYFKITHNCTLGNNNGFCPELEDWVFMFPNSKVVGKSHIGHHSIISTNTYIKDTEIPPYSIVFGSYPNLIIKENKPEMYKHSNLAVFKQ